MPTLTARSAQVQMLLAAVSVGGKTIVAGGSRPKIRFSGDFRRRRASPPVEPRGRNALGIAALYAPSEPFFDSFLACFSVRFSFSDLPTFLALC